MSALADEDRGFDGRPRLGARCLARYRRGVAKALRSLGADVTEVDVRGRKFQIAQRRRARVHRLHGTFGEDGQVQQILEDRGVAYTGEDVEGSRLAFDKICSKEKFRERGNYNTELAGDSRRPAANDSTPIVIKAPRQGSTVGVYIVKTDREIASALQDGAKYDQEFLVEKFVPGRELTIGILGDLALPILEIIPKGGFYDFTNKYPFLNPSAAAARSTFVPRRSRTNRRA